MRRAHIRTAAALVLLAVGASCSNDEAGDRAAEAQTEPPTTLAADISANDVDDAPTTSPTRTEPSTPPTAAPVEFTACINPGPEVTGGTTEPVVVQLSDGEMTIFRERGDTFRQSLTAMTDPRLEGTLYQAWDKDRYTVPGNEPGPEFVTFTDRIENDDGAWQGSAVLLEFPDGALYVAPIVMTGEGAYEGLTAIVAFESFGEECTVRGYIIEGGVPPAPVPQAGQ